MWQRFDAACKRLDQRWEAWLDSRLSPLMDAVIALYPLIALTIIAVLFLL